MKPKRKVGDVAQTVTVGQAAAALSLSATMVKKLIRRGRLVAFKTPLGHLISKRSLAAERRRRLAA